MLGRFAVRRIGREIDLSAGCQRLIALLGMRGISISREQAAGILWPEATRERAANRLRTCLYRMGAIGEALVVRTERTLCIAPDVAIDYISASAKGKELCSSQPPLTKADFDLEPFAHDLLPGWYDDWIVFEREAFRQLRFGALEAIASEWIGAGRTDQAIQACLLVTRSEPLRESAHRLLARAHAADGNPAQALRQLNEYAEMLDKEMGTGPSHFMIDLRDQITSVVDKE